MQIQMEAKKKRAEKTEKLQQFCDEQKEKKLKLMLDLSDKNQFRDKRLADANAEQMKKEESRKAEMENLIGQIQKSNFIENFPLPMNLQNHKNDHPDAFYIQVIGGRGAGKSTFINKILKQLKMEQTAATGTEECTLETEFFSITEKLNQLSNWKHVFLCDQPGIGGLKIKEREYIKQFGIGEF